MKKLLILASCALFAALSSQATVVVNEDFSGYGDGDIDGVNGWLTSTNGMTNQVVSGELMLDPNGDRVMFSGASADLMPGDSVQITVDYRLGVESVRRHSGHFGFGIQTNGAAADTIPEELINTYVFSFALEPAFRFDGQVNQFPDSQQWQGPGTFELMSSDYGMNPHGYYTNVAPYDAAAYIDAESDDMRSIYTITKSHIANEFNVSVTTSNLNTGVSGSGSDTGIVRTNAWDSSALYLTLYSSGDGNTNYIQSVMMETIPPSASSVPVGVSALGLDGEVSLSWDVAAGASTYEIYRSTTEGVQGSLLTTVGTESYLDPVANGSTYYYTIVAKYYNVDSDPSVQVSATPAKIYSDEVVYNNDFTANALGDLATTDPDWGELTGSSNNAFWVIDDASDKKIDTVATESFFTNTVGNGVFLSRNMGNMEDDAIQGSFDVMLSLTADGTNDADQTHCMIMSWGLTGSTAEAPDVTSSQQALMSLGIRAENRLVVNFGSENVTDSAQQLAIWGYSEMGWNPKPNWPSSWGGNSALPRDLETDPLHVSWKIRKTREVGVYQAWVTVTNLTTGFAAQINNEFKTATALDVWNSPASLFSMAHYKTAKQDGNFSYAHVTVDNVELSHSTGNLPVVQAPVISNLLRGDRFVSFEWDHLLDAAGYTVTIETPDSEIYTIAEDTLTTSINDAPRWNGIANTYTVTADFGTAGMSSTNFSAAPVGMVPYFETATAFAPEMVSTVPVVSNNTQWASQDAMTTPFFENGVDGYTGPTVYGMVKGVEDGAHGAVDVTTDIISNGRLRHRVPQAWSQSPYASSLTFIKVSDMGGSETSFDATAAQLFVRSDWGSWTLGNNGNAENGARIAIRNGNTWYASDYNELTNPGGDYHSLVVDDVANANWRVLTVPDVNTGAEISLGATVDGSTFTDVNAVGWYNRGFWSCTMYELEVQTSGALSSYDYWSLTQYNLGTNAAPELDPDADGIINANEYAYNGDPKTPNTASLPTAVLMGAPGSEFVQYAYKMQRDPDSGIKYIMKTTTDLVNGDGNSNYGVWSTNNHSSAETIQDYYWINVTNDVPYGTGIGETFIDLEIQSN